ncbi:two-component regulator propeller domain-containing protein [Mucilaginibacter sp. X5P1]|uniref:hybrid sensor histidine kinase/response regulator transcription factor n=1 Tax=Mucilaginibacter sp. X5P1 TaxID=2723088 RepID=UPI001607E3C3|nr:hybrid sensor histidine kinase/response regulator transcription factor [Mucilaginibacter sp. X5P1]MBB6141494.1 signal transduction histidine kinase/ligand-binding sensor domain-containing protein/DNA-binding response OmpR family regulator [Mucilaginibacter sp. X5P1]
MRIRFYILLTIIFFACINTFAQSSQYQFSQLDISNGLSHNQVNCIYKDSEGFMWFGTASGLNRYDGYTFKVFKHDADNKNSLLDDFIVNIFEGPDKKLYISTRTGYCFYDPETEQFNSDMSLLLKPLKLPVYPLPSRIVRNDHGDFWFLYPDSGLYRYNALSRQTIRYYHHNKAKLSLYSNSVADITEDAKGNIWLVYEGGMVEMLDTKHNRISYSTDIFNKVINNKTGYYSITVDSDNDLWLYTPTVNTGVYYYSPSTGVFRRLDKESAGTKLKSAMISNIIQADDGLIWIATDQGGINILDKKNFKVTYLLNREEDAKSLRQNTVMLYKDNTGIMWAGTFKEGISYYHKNIIRFALYRHFASDPGSLSFDDVDKFVEDRQGNLWIGTNGGGLIYFNRKTGKFTQYRYDPENPNSLSNDIIVSLCIDHDQKLWIGTYFGGLNCFDGKTFTHYKHDDKVATSIADDRIWSIFEDSSQRLWIGTFAGGLEIFDRSKKVFYHPFKRADIRCSFISSIIEDKSGNIWVGGYLGIDVIIKKSNRVIHYTRNPNDTNSLIDDNINSIKQDSRDLFWIATREGLSILNQKTNSFTSLTKKNGLPDNSILDILEDDKGTMWLSTSNGLSRITLTPGKGAYTFQFENFDETDGLQGREFNLYAALKTSKGEMLFGGGHGFNIFDPRGIRPNINKPKLIFTNFQLFNKSIAANELFNGHVVLTKVISATHEISLRHSENVFTIEFAAVNFFNPNKIKYQYMMAGFDKGWLSADNAIRKATYTNLDAGDYVFKVRAFNSEGLWNPDYITLKIKVLPPFWKSTPAYIIYLALFIGTLLFIRRRGIQKIRREFAVEKEKQEAKLLIEQERQEVKRMHELDQLKIKFLTNVSHEFRTPLSLIMAPVDRMFSHADSEQKQQLNMIKRNAKRLLNLVNQLLDFRKMEVQELKLHSKPGDIIRFIKEISLSFTDIATEKGIGFAFDSEAETLITSFDHDKIERILFNLLSNAFKFTPMGGHISVLLNLLHEKSSDELRLLEIKVIDTGIGIPHEKHNKIFERFFQHDIPESLINQGSGIGLSITREFVRMHGGEITVESEPNHGACFIIRLPMPVEDNLIVAFNDGENEPEELDALQIAEDNERLKHQYANKKPVVLLVEDNDDFRFYLKDNLKDVFFIVEASNGKEGWQKALSQHPDIMVSDISMPEMDGISLCKKIKEDKRTSHIPIILLTALTGEEEEVKGLAIGANDYMTKPFNFEILLSKIKNLLTLQDSFKRTYKKQMNVQVQEVDIQSEDEKLLRKVVEYIEQNISNDNLSVEELSRHVNMSRGSLYTKVLMLTGKSPVEFIRSIRLKKAVYLLENSQMTISQISYEVGFNTPKYFAKLFKCEYNILPSAYVSSLSQKDLTKVESKN